MAGEGGLRPAAPCSLLPALPRWGPPRAGSCWFLTGPALGRTDKLHLIPGATGSPWGYTFPFSRGGRLAPGCKFRYGAVSYRQSLGAPLPLCFRQESPTFGFPSGRGLGPTPSSALGQEVLTLAVRAPRGGTGGQADSEVSDDQPDGALRRGVLAVGPVCTPTATPPGRFPSGPGIGWRGRGHGPPLAWAKHAYLVGCQGSPGPNLRWGTGATASSIREGWPPIGCSMQIGGPPPTPLGVRATPPCERCCGCRGL